MPEVHLLEELLIVLALTVSIVYLFRKIRVPAIVGFLLAGKWRVRRREVRAHL
jgi:Kef-type K+ transport system membrane component KefB